METIQITEQVPIERISDMLCTAFDPGYGSSYYWARIKEKIAPKTWTYQDKMRPNTGGHWVHEFPLSEGGALIIHDVDGDNGDELRLDLPAIQKGLQLMLREHPRHYAEFKKENDDGETADVFVQCCLFGEIIYG